MMTRCLIDQHVMHKDAYVIPFWLADDARPAHPAGAVPLFDIQAEGAGTGAGRPNLSERALEYLAGIGVTDAGLSPESAALIWLHALAVGYSPLYLEENGDAIRNDWPRVPLPATIGGLRASAKLGQRIADLLDLDTNDAVLGPLASERRRTIAVLTKAGGGAVMPERGDLAITAGWAIEQTRVQRSGAVSRIVMPGGGKALIRHRADDERGSLSSSELDLLGTGVVDVYLNDDVYWRGIPQAVWDFKVGGFQVLRKWLSYRASNILERDLTLAEVRVFTSICLRLTELVLLGPELDSNYVQAAEAE